MNPLLETDLYKSTLKNSLTDVFKTLLLEIYDVIDSLGESRQDYHVSVCPFSIERTDGKPIPRKLLLGIQKKLKT